MCLRSTHHHFFETWRTLLGVSWRRSFFLLLLMNLQFVFWCDSKLIMVVFKASVVICSKKIFHGSSSNCQLELKKAEWIRLELNHCSSVDGATKSDKFNQKLLCWPLRFNHSTLLKAFFKWYQIKLVLVLPGYWKKKWFVLFFCNPSDLRVSHRLYLKSVSWIFWL